MIPLRHRKDGWLSYGLEIKGKLFEYMGTLRIHQTSTRMYWETDEDVHNINKDIVDKK